MRGEQTTAKSGVGRADRFYQNPILRDAEWDRAKQPPWWLTVLVVVIVGAAFVVGVFSGEPNSFVGWVVGVVAIAVYVALNRLRRPWARRRLRKLHQAS